MTDEDYLREYFGEPISIYNDQDALNDGILIDITSLNLVFEEKSVNRITIALFASMEQLYPAPDCWTIDLEACGRAMGAKLATATGEGRLRTIPPDMWLVENEVNGWTLMFPSDY
ncbi:MAG: hypothetical protein WBV94_22515 [Blastocatellia bacterium]